MTPPAPRRRPRAWATALPALVACALTGCGIQETPVVEAGRPAVADLLPPREGRVLVFLYAPSGELRPVPRIVDVPWDGTAGTVPTDAPDGPVSPHAALTALLTGPDRAERRAGWHSAPGLPRATALTSPPETDGDDIGVRLRVPVKKLPGPARDQIVCTAAYAAPTRGTGTVTLTGPDGPLTPSACPVRPAPGR